MKIRIIAVGKIKDQMIRRKIEDYFRKLGKGIEVVSKEVPDGKARALEELKKQEAGEILANLPERSFIVALDERGKELNSWQFAELIKKLSHQSLDLALIIGGAYGLEDKVRSRADLVLALSQLTFSHELARLILAEQIFRAFSLIKGTPYHH